MLAVRRNSITLLQVCSNAIHFYDAMLPAPAVIDVGSHLSDFQIGERRRWHGLVKHFVVHHDFAIATMPYDANHFVEMLIDEVRLIQWWINATQAGSGLLVTVAAVLRINLLTPNEILLEFDRIFSFTSGWLPAGHTDQE